MILVNKDTLIAGDNFIKITIFSLYNTDFLTEHLVI